MPIWIIFVLIGMIAVAVVSMQMGKKSQRAQEATKLSFYKKAYAKLAKNFITQKSIRSIYTQLSNLSVYKREELYNLTTKYFLMSWGASSALILISFVMFDDFITVLMCLAFAVLLNRTIIDKQLDNQYFKVLEATSKALGSIRQEYMRTGSVVEAINEAEIDDILKRPFDELYTILTSTDAELRLQEFYAATPFRTLQTLVGICHNVNNQGDTRNTTGESNFVQALTILSTDVNAEITKITTQKKKFGKIEYLPFLPILAIGLIESYFTGIMPGTALIYGGPIGYICRTLTIVAAIVCYSIISGINRTVPVKENDETEWALKLLAKPKWKAFIHNIKAKNKKAYFLQRRFKGALSRQTIESFYTKKVVYSGVIFIISILTAFSVISLGGAYVKNSTQQLSLVATNEMERYSKESILELDNKYFEQRLALQPEKSLKGEVEAIVQKVQKLFGLTPKGSILDKQGKYPNLSEDATKALVQSYMPGLTDLQVIDQLKRLDDKFVTVMNTKFHWWLIWVCFLFGYIGWKIPESQLKIRRIMVRTEAEDDFLQLQTLVSIFMTTDMDTLDTLYEMSQHSRIHKEMLTYCYHSFPANPELELTRLQAKTPLTEFKRFIGKLKLTINDLSLSEAFSDLVIEREQIMRIRELTINATIDKKRGLCGPLSLTPLGFMVVGELLIPLGYLGYREFMNALTMM